MYLNYYNFKLIVCFFFFVMELQQQLADLTSSRKKSRVLTK